MDRSKYIKVTAGTTRPAINFKKMEKGKIFKIWHLSKNGVMRIIKKVETKHEAVEFRNKMMMEFHDTNILVTF